MYMLIAFKCPVLVMRWAGGVGSASSLWLEIPFVLIFSSLGLFTPLGEKRHNFLRMFVFSLEGCRQDRAMLSVVVTSCHTRDESVMFLHSLMWCFRQMRWVERQEIYSVMSSPVKNIIRKSSIFLAYWFSKYQQYVKCFQETCKKQLFPQIIHSHGRLSSAGVRVCFPFFIALFQRGKTEKHQNILCCQMKRK